MSLDLYLQDLEARIDPQVEDELLARWRQFLTQRWPEPVFAPRRPEPSPPRIDWPAIRVNQTLDDFDAMAMQQFRGCSDVLSAGSGNAMMVRANYGTPIMPIAFGAELFVMPEETNTLPGSHPVPGGAEAMRAMLDRQPPSLDHPYLQKVFEMGRRFVRLKKDYPRVDRYVRIYHPDLQGPMDILEMLWGSDFFVHLYDEPDLVHRVLQLITDTYIRVLREWEKIVPLAEEGITGHWGLLYRGGIMLRDDSAMNLPPEMFDEFIRPYDQQLLSAFGGGAIHACGRVDHFAPFLPRMKGLYAFNMSQPHLNDMEIVWNQTVDQGLSLVGFSTQAAESALAQGRDLRGRVHVI